MSISVTDPLESAWRHMVRVCFKPFDLGKWFGLGFCAWLAYLGEGGGFNFFGNGSSHKQGGGGPDFSGPVAFVKDHWILFVALGAVLLALLLVLVVVLCWLRSRGKFMFLDGVVHNRALVVQPWKQFRRLGHSLFLFNIVFGLVCLAVFLVIAGLGVLIAWADIVARQFGGASILAIVVGGLLFLPMGFVLLAVMLFLEDFVVPIMYHTDQTVLPAWGTFRRQVLHGHVGEIVLYYLLRLAINLALGIAIVLSFCLTCCLSACILLLPYLGAVLLLPVYVFKRAWSVYMLEQFGEPWRIFPAAAPPEYFPPPGPPMMEPPVPPAL